MSVLLRKDHGFGICRIEIIINATARLPFGSGMSYKIGLLASHGTGKTTMAHLVAGELKRRGLRVRVIPEVATEARETGKTINEQTTLRDQAWILHVQCKYEIEAELNKYDVIICDRTVHDNYCYLANACGEQEHFVSLVLGHSKLFPYDALYYVPILAVPASDGLRATSVDFQQAIDKKLREYLDRHGIKYAKLPIETDAERTGWIKMIVEETLSHLPQKSLCP